MSHRRPESDASPRESEFDMLFESAMTRHLDDNPGADEEELLTDLLARMAPFVADSTFSAMSTTVGTPASPFAPTRTTSSESSRMSEDAGLSAEVLADLLAKVLEGNEDKLREGQHNAAERLTPLRVRKTVSWAAIPARSSKASPRQGEGRAPRAEDVCVALPEGKITAKQEAELLAFAQSQTWAL
ncbi:hypothetical protein T484DRAFT_1922410 [Baffinella frigidus]|nr:hypothetical protein T484DRAFT_1922410 [Cryptophyta sp. CCMP2293]